MEASNTPAAAISGAPAPAAPITLNELIDRYLAAYTGRDRCRHARVGWWRERLGAHPAVAVTDDDIFAALEAYAAAPARVFAGLDADGRRIFRAKGSCPAPATINRHQNALSAVFQWGIERRLLPRDHRNPARLVKRRREADGRIRFLTPEERARLLDAAKASKWPRLYLLVLMALTTGARKGELLRLTWGDVSLERSVAYVAETKNAQPRVLPLVPAVVEELHRFAQARADALVFPSRLLPKRPYFFQQRWEEALRIAGIRGFRFHDLRHSCASALAQEGASLLEIADVLGHKQLAMTKRYSHLTVGSKAALVNRVLGAIR